MILIMDVTTTLAFQASMKVNICGVRAHYFLLRRYKLVMLMAADYEY